MASQSQAAYSHKSDSRQRSQIRFSAMIYLVAMFFGLGSLVADEATEAAQKKAKQEQRREKRLEAIKAEAVKNGQSIPNKFNAAIEPGPVVQNPFAKGKGEKGKVPGKGNGEMLRKRIAELNTPVTPATPQDIIAISTSAKFAPGKKDQEIKPLPNMTAAKPDAVAKKIDDMLGQEIFSKAAPPIIAKNKETPVSASTSIVLQPRVDDSTFLRRVMLDIVGRIPTPEELTAFTLDPSSTKRAVMVDKLLAQPEYGENWSHYWRDVVMYRRSEDRAMVAADPLAKYLAEEFNNNTPWDKMARDFITATGNVTEEGNAAIFMAQMGDTEDVTAEVSRIFMGVQIQCAQCHDHPSDRWKREQFHELAAFFPRNAIRPIRDTKPPTFELVSVDRERFGKGNDNGKPRGATEHFMPDLKDPSSKGTRVEPIFFMNGKQLPPGLTDSERRGVAAMWIAGKDNPWFAKAFVNRIWSELTGEGFSEPVDDLGPDREKNNEVVAPKTFEYLAAQFQANKYDIKWLMRTIMHTDAYQRMSQSRRNTEQTPFTGNVAQRLRGDQLYSALTSVFGVSTFPPLAQTAAGRGPYSRDPRNVFNAAWGYDPSVRRDEVASSIPQALAMMNGGLNGFVRGDRGGTVLGKMLKENSKDADVASELYLRCLSREPRTDELQTCLAHVKAAKSRSEGFEDILWALINSTEFLHRK